MTSLRLGTWLIVGLAAVILGAGVASAHGYAAPVFDSPPYGGAIEDAGSWMGAHMGHGADSWMWQHMGPSAMPMGYAAGTAGSAYSCPGAWSGGMMNGGMMAGPGGWGQGGWGMAGTGQWGLGFLGPLLLVALALGLGYILLTRTSGSRSDRALEALRERYAAGEISAEEFDARRETLQA